MIKATDFELQEVMVIPTLESLYILPFKNKYEKYHKFYRGWGNIFAVRKNVFSDVFTALRYVLQDWDNIDNIIIDNSLYDTLMSTTDHRTDGGEPIYRFSDLSTKF